MPDNIPDRFHALTKDEETALVQRIPAQWGRGTLPASGGVRVNFTVPFGSVPKVTLTPHVDQSAVTLDVLVDGTGFTLTPSGDSPGAFSWFAQE